MSTTVTCIVCASCTDTTRRVTRPASLGGLVTQVAGKLGQLDS